MKRNHRELKLKDGEDLINAYFRSRRKSTAHRQWETNRKFQVLMEVCPYPVFVLDEENRITDCNHLSAECLGYSQEELIGKPFAHLLRPKSKELFTAGLPHLPWRGRPGEPFQFVMKGGETLSFDVQWYPIHDEMKTNHGFVCTLHESDPCSPRKGKKHEPWNHLANWAGMIDDLKKTRQLLQETRLQLIRSEKLALFGQLISGVAHELNNLLTSICGFSQLIVTRHQLSPSVHKDLMKIADEAQRAGGIIHNLQKFGRDRSATKSSVQLRSIIDRTIELMEYTLRVNNIHVEKKYDPQVPFLYGDNYQLQQVFLNILQNAEYAIASTRRSGLIRITFRLMAKEKKVRIFFCNNGPHIPTGNLDKIFKPFFTTKPEDKGTGLGLFISSAIIKDHGGTIHVRSKKGKGVAFMIDLPVPDDLSAKALFPEPVEVRPVVKPVSRKRILVVDDEMSIVELMEKALSSRGHTVDYVLRSEEALEKIIKGNYDVILCDIKMPGMSGPAIYHAVKKLDMEKAQKFIFCTGDTMGEATLNFFRQHPLPTLEKPFRLEAVFELIDAAGG
ncbi:MAG: response regulator [Deltaproteobacteria bacterium]|nr:response regulator [Deltaproteobacteria bacterium]MBW2306816.1 response regulator [Deltaproteobacteria bacterium]